MPSHRGAETFGATERIIGSWLKARGNRDRVIIASKVVGRSPMDWFREGGIETRLTPAQIDVAVEGSLRRLQTDYIDLYQLHWPDRRLGILAATGTGTTIPTMCRSRKPWAPWPAHVEKGSIRHIGVSNESAWA